MEQISNFGQFSDLYRFLDLYSFRIWTILKVNSFEFEQFEFEQILHTRLAEASDLK
jgi:hypothetical protein